MNKTRGMLLATAAMLAASSLPLIEAEARQPIKPQPKTQERLTKAEKKRARKAAQRLKLAQGKGASRE